MLLPAVDQGQTSHLVVKEMFCNEFVKIERVIPVIIKSSNELLENSIPDIDGQMIQGSSDIL